PKNNKQETQNKIVYITQNHTTNTHVFIAKDAHAHYATTNHHTNTTTNQQEKPVDQPWVVYRTVSECLTARLTNTTQANTPNQGPSHSSVSFLRVPNKKQTLKTSKPLRPTRIKRFSLKNP
ncbi:hypothetical protein R6H00_10510, partial [Actinotignum timonense]|uniref:hypothetical protein n=1 Tax=Actinotignum timonense TaxID=1870995 RepID=UPI002A80381D